MTRDEKAPVAARAPRKLSDEARDALEVARATNTPEEAGAFLFRRVPVRVLNELLAYVGRRKVTGETTTDLAWCVALARRLRGEAS